MMVILIFLVFICFLMYVSFTCYIANFRKEWDLLTSVQLRLFSNLVYLLVIKGFVEELQITSNILHTYDDVYHI